MQQSLGSAPRPDDRLRTANDHALRPPSAVSGAALRRCGAVRSHTARAWLSPRKPENAKNHVPGSSAHVTPMAAAVG
jgi:hypothetical protein